VEWSGMEEKERKDESGNILAGQAGMKSLAGGSMWCAGCCSFFKCMSAGDAG